MSKSDPQKGHRKTKIVATLGPATRSAEKIEELILAGVNVIRLNFSHGSHAEHLESLKRVRKASEKLDIPVAVLQDLSGPKIRISNVEGNYVTVRDNDFIELFYAGAYEQADPESQRLSSARKIFVETVNPSEVLIPGQHALLADGIIELQALEVGPQLVKCRVLKGGRLRSRVGIAFPESTVNLPAGTTKDMQDLDWGIENCVDYVAISFVQKASDMLMFRTVLQEKNDSIRLIAKIERRAAIENIDEILDNCDGLMIARGDLGLELPLEQVPVVQQKLIEQANYRGLPVIVATQMLHSMITSARPTRAEVTDIAFAVTSGADAVMLSEETAIGEHPLHAVEYLGRIALEAEKAFTFDQFKLRLRDADRLTVSDAVAYAAAAAAVKVKASAVIACTTTGTSARLLAKYRPQQPLYGVAINNQTLRRMALYWGVSPIRAQATSTHADELETAIAKVQKREDLPKGSRVVITGGAAVSTPGSTSVLEIREV